LTHSVHQLVTRCGASNNTKVLVIIKHATFRDEKLQQNGGKQSSHLTSANELVSRPKRDCA